MLKRTNPAPHFLLSLHLPHAYSPLSEHECHQACSQAWGCGDGGPGNGNDYHKANGQLPLVITSASRHAPWMHCTEGGVPFQVEHGRKGHGLATQNGRHLETYCDIWNFLFSIFRLKLITVTRNSEKQSYRRGEVLRFVFQSLPKGVLKVWSPACGTTGRWQRPLCPWEDAFEEGFGTQG